MECFRMYYMVVTLLFIAVGQSEAGDIEYEGKVPQTVFVGDNVTFQWLYTGTEKVSITTFFILEDSFERLVYYAVSLKNSKPQLEPDTIKKYAKTVKWDGDYENNQYYFTLVNVTDFSHKKNFSIQLQLDDTDGSLLDAFTKDLLFISVVPEVELRIDQTNVSVGDRVSIECNIIKQGRPEATITLYHNNTSLESKKEGSLSYRKEVELKDAGSYRCKAKNTAGDDDSEIIKITVHEKSQKNEGNFTEKPGSRKSSGGLGGGAIAGIVVGILLVLVVIVIVIILMKRRTRVPKSNKSATVNDDESKSAMMSKPDKDQVWL